MGTGFTTANSPKGETMTIHDTDVALTEAAPSEDATQSIHAWSQTDDDDTELVITHRRSWKLPVITAALATAAVAGGIYQVWPQQHSAPAPARTVSAPPKAQTPDERFLSLVQQRGFHVYVPSMSVHAAHDVCTAETQGFSDPAIAQGVVNSTPSMDMKTAAAFVDTAIEVYCPPKS